MTAGMLARHRSTVRRASDAWNGFWFEPVTPLNLGVCRLLFFGLLLLWARRQDFAGWHAIPGSYYQPVWAFRILNLPILPDQAMRVLVVLWKFGLMLSCVGLLTRPCMTLAFPLTLYFCGLPNNTWHVMHQTAILVFTHGLLAFSQCGDGVSLDCLIRRARGMGPMPPSGEYCWPPRAVCLLLALVFFAAGVAKLRHSGLAWITSDALARILIAAQYQPFPPHHRWGLWLAGFPWLCRLLAAGVVSAEILFPLALLSRAVRRLLLPTMLAMQIGIGFMMNIWFVSFLMVYPFWVQWDHLIVALKNCFERLSLTLRPRLARQSRHELAECGAAAFCNLENTR